jgi:outer membrane PBP1 activator LpoA protein
MRAPPSFFLVSSRAARAAICAGLSIVFAAAALSCAPVRPATRVQVIRPPASVARAPEPLPPPGALRAEVPDDAPDVETSPLRPPPDALAAAPPDAVPRAPDADGDAPLAPTSDLIALILPLDVAAYERAAGAVRDGFFDAAERAGARGNCIVIAHGVDGVIPAFETARARGVRVAVGPLVRDDLKTLAIAGLKLPWTLALNQLDDGTRLPSAIFSLPLTVESDGRMLAQRALASGARSVDVIEGDSPLMRRFAGAFAMAWSDSGGRAPDAFRFDPAPDALTGLRRTLQQSGPDAVLLAVNGDRAALVKPFIGNIRAYASGLVFERPSQAVARDLDGVRVVEIPWLLTPDAPEFAGLPRRDFDSAALARLYALGLDAFRVAASFRDGPPLRFDLDGATGHVSLGPGRQFVREGKLAVYRNGELVPLDSAP